MNNDLSSTKEKINKKQEEEKPTTSKSRTSVIKQLFTRKTTDFTPESSSKRTPSPAKKRFTYFTRHYFFVLSRFYAKFAESPSFFRSSTSSKCFCLKWRRDHLKQCLVHRKKFSARFKVVFRRQEELFWFIVTPISPRRQHPEILSLEQFLF